MLNFRGYHEEANIRGQWRSQRWNSLIPSCLYLVWGNNNYWVCIHSCQLNICCESWSDEVKSIQCNCWIDYRYWCHRWIKVSWKLLILAFINIWICTTINLFIQRNSYLLWWYVFCIGLTDYLTILSNINLLAYSWSIYIN